MLDIKLFKELCEAPGIPGREQAIIDIMTRELKKTVDEVSVDSLGNVIGLKKSQKKNAKKVMITGHMDEIGFVVSHVDSKGFIRFSPRGGHVPRVLVSQRVKIFGKKTLIGVVEGAPAFLNPDDMLKTPKLDQLFIDTGLNPKEVKKLVDIGDVIVMDRDFIEIGDTLMSKAFDNRVGCFVVLETMKKLKKLNVDVYAVGSSQEEVGIRGAMTAARGIIPDFGVAIDVTAAFDVPGVAEHMHVTRLGEGTAIKIADSATISNHGIVLFLKSLAKKHKIKHQMEILPFGGTDARAMQMFGSGAVCTLSVPSRYVHSPNEILLKKDVEATVNLLVKFIENCESCKLIF
jgi:endoglucanase